MAWVTMTVSVGEDHVAGERYNLAADLADRYILKGYAEGDLSGDYSAEEQQAIVASSVFSDAEAQTAEVP